MATLADFLCILADGSDRPKSVLNTAIAAVSAFVGAVNIQNPVTSDIARLVTVLIKTGTSQSMQRSKVMPVKPFHELFIAWGSNWSLELENLRLETITFY